MSDKNIVLADDDPIMRELAEARLRDAGYNVTAVENGAEALKCLSAGGVDLVISDLDMPVLDGFELTRRVRADPKAGQTPVIVITGSDHGDAVERAFAAGATSFLSKPINWTLFGHAVKFVLRAGEDQKALRIARDQAQAGEKFKDQLLSIMSHELRTPLNAIIGFGQLLGEQFNKNNDNLHKEYADYIVDGGRRLLNSISDMLLASDARSGPITINEKETTLGDLLKDAVTLAPHAGSSQMANANISMKVKDADMEICCDCQLMARAISKLIDNALKFTPQDQSVIIAAAPNKNGDLAIMVKDSGPGIEPEKLAAVTAPFTQSEMSSRRTKEGIGLGLPLVKAIAQAHGAAFRIDSTPGEGVRAVLLIPSARIGAVPSGQIQSVA